MKTLTLLIPIVIGLGGCTPATFSTKTYESGDSSSVIASSGERGKHYADALYASKKHSANLHDYRQAYILAFLEAQETGMIAPDKPNVPFFKGTDIAFFSALNLATGNITPFSPGFLVGGIILGLLMPDSEESKFANAASRSWRGITSSTVRYIELTPLPSTKAEVIDQRNEEWFERVDHTLTEAGVHCEFASKRREEVRNGFNRSMVKKCELLGNEAIFDMAVYSVLASPESNFTKKLGTVIVSTVAFPFGHDHDDLVAQTVAKLKPFIDKDWFTLYPGPDASGQRRMFVSRGDDVAVFDLPPEPFKKKDQGKTPDPEK